MKKDTLTKTLAIFGTLFIWFPLLAPVIFSTIRYAADQRLRFDYLMPAELFPVGLLGGFLLIWAARRAGVQLKRIAWGMGIAVASLVLGQTLALVTGLASGEMEASGFWFGLVLASLFIFIVALAAAAVGGLLLLIHTFKSSQPAKEVAGKE